ncbi:MAG: 8-oxoguanine deaminase [Firmicutes bacterium]|nr:8-oxoguanine deaminase [Bacillota bacterium]
MSTLLIKDASYIVTMDESQPLLRDASIFIRDGQIEAIGEGLWTQADEVVAAKGRIVYPGLVNTHHHLYQVLTRNLPRVQRMELFDWLKILYRLWRGIDGEMVYTAAQVGLGELVRYGCTTSADHHYVFPPGQGDLIDRQIEAAQTLGIRFHATRGGMSLGESAGGLPPDDLVQSSAVILKDSQRLIETYHDPAPLAMTRVALAPCSPFSVTADLLRESAALARAYGVRLHTHLAETKDEERFCLATTGRRPLDYMEEVGWLGEDVWYAHGIYLNDDELQRMAFTGTGVAHCPVSNMKLSSGVVRLPKMLKQGVPVGLAVDGSASNDGSDLLAEIRTAYLLHRLQYGGEAPTAEEILALATRGSARLLGRDDIGVLAIGKAGDLFIVSTDRLEMAGTLEDPVTIPAVVGINRPVDMTVVNGRVIYRDGVFAAMDEQGVARRAEKMAHRLLRQI